jgi:hypothetical protein
MGPISLQVPSITGRAPPTAFCLPGEPPLEIPRHGAVLSLDGRAADFRALLEMNIDTFWQIIGDVHQASGGDMDRKCELLKVRLEELDDAELLDFSRHFEAMNATAYTWPLWGAAYVMNGGCSDDGFSDFRGTLISLGRVVFERALADPESLAEVDYAGEDVRYEGFQYVAQEILRERGLESPRSVPFPAEPTGEEWNEDEAELAALYPKLTARYARTGGGPGALGSLGPAKPWWKIW